MKLWLDDTRDPVNCGHIGWTWAKTAAEAIELLQTGTVERASLDHDLSIAATLGNWRNEVTGYDVVLFMEASGIWPPGGVEVHSQNPDGRDRMLMVIDRHYAGDVEF